MLPCILATEELRIDALKDIATFAGLPGEGIESPIGEAPTPPLLCQEVLI